MLSIKPSYHSARQTVSDILVITLLLAVFYAIWIGSHALFTPDEGRYSEVAREMVATGDYITPRLNGVVFLDKPIFYYWLQASAIKLFGIKEWSLRFWPALIGVLGCLVTYLAGRVLFDRRTGILAAVILATCPVYYGAAHYANLDLEVAVLISNSLLFFIMAMRVPKPTLRLFFLVSAYVFAGLAALTKGLIGIAFPVMVIGTWILVLNQWATLKKMHLIIGLIIFTAISLPWYVLVQKANPEFFQFFFVKQQVSRFLTTEHFNNRTPGWFYFPIVLAGIFPWCVFVIQALLKPIKAVWQNRHAHSSELFLLLWIGLIFTFFSIPKSKTIGYIIPILPAIALLVGHYLSSHWQMIKSKGIYIGFFAFLILSIGIITASLSVPSMKSLELNANMFSYLTLSAGLFSISTGIMLLLLKRKRLPPLFFALTSTAVAFLLLIAASSGAMNEKTIKPLATQIKHQLQPTDEIVTYFKYFQDLPIYLERRITVVADWNAADIPLNDNWVRELWYGIPFQDTSAWLINEDIFWQRWNSDKRLFVFTDPSQYERLKKQSQIPVYKIAQFNQAILISNKADLTIKS